MKYLSLFSGIGGFEIGIQRAYRDRRQTEKPSLDERTTASTKVNKRKRKLPTCIGYSEIDKYAIKVYERHFNHENYGDITAIKPDRLPDFDLVVGGFPCQAFSIAGKRGGFDDTRGTLFFDIARILKIKRPRHLLLENVKGLLSHDSGKTFQTILKVLSDLGYRVEWQVLNSKYHGVPQNRERIFIVGHLGEECRSKVFPIEQTHSSLIEQLEQGVQASEIAQTVTATYWKGGKGSHVSEQQVSDNRSDQSDLDNADRRKARATRWRIRRLTPKECERLQGFPDDWTAGESDTQRYKMCGNAVTTNVIKDIVGKLKTCLT